MRQESRTNFKLTYDDSARDQRHLDLQKAIRPKSKPDMMINRSSKIQTWRDKVGKVDEDNYIYFVDKWILTPKSVLNFECRLICHGMSKIMFFAHWAPFARPVASCFVWPLYLSRARKRAAPNSPSLIGRTIGIIIETKFHEFWIYFIFIFSFLLF